MVSTSEETPGGSSSIILEGTPLFKLKLGIAPSSEGIPCAKAAGVPDSVLQRAQEIKKAITNKEPIRPAVSQNPGPLSQINRCRLVDLFLRTDWAKLKVAEEAATSAGDSLSSADAAAATAVAVARAGAAAGSAESPLASSRRSSAEVLRELRALLK